MSKIKKNLLYSSRCHGDTCFFGCLLLISYSVQVKSGKGTTVSSNLQQLEAPPIIY
jgi:hypothetical protein